MSDQIATGRGAAYRAASEALHLDHSVAERHAAQFRMLWDCGFADLIRDDFYGVLALPQNACANLLEAGCGTGIETVNLRRWAPGLNIHGVDISAVALAGAVARPDAGDTVFHQAALERLPFADGAFDYITSHEVIEHVEDPAVVLREFARILQPGGVCALATPNGASWWIEHLRQRVKRMLGRRGAPIGEDHTRPPSFWRREFARAGFVVERQIFDAAAIEFQMFIAPARWMPVLSRVLEPLRAVPGINLVLCDRVKFRLRKPGLATSAPRPISPCCPICRADLAEGADVVCCGSGHRFGLNPLRLVDFSALAAATVSAPSASVGVPNAGVPMPNAGVAVPVAAAVPSPRSIWMRRLRRLVLFGLSTLYAGFLLLLAPLGMAAGMFYQPFKRPRLWLRDIDSAP